MPLPQSGNHPIDLGQRLEDGHFANRVRPGVVTQEQAQRGHHAGAQSLEVVAPLEHQHDLPAAEFVGQVDERLGQLGVAVHREHHRAERVAPVGVVAGGDQDKLRLEPPQRGRDHLLEDQRVALVTSAEGQGHVQRRAGGLRGAAHLANAARARVERRGVGRAEQHPRFFVEDVLRPVAVVDIVVHNGDPLQTDVIEGVARGHGDVVDQAEAHGPPGGRVVSRRPHQREGVVGPALDDRLDRVDRAAGGEHRGLPRVGGHIRINIELAAAVAGELADLAEQIGAVDGQKRRFGRRARREVMHELAQAAAVQRGADGLEPCGLFDVPVPGVGVEGGIGQDCGGAHRCELLALTRSAPPAARVAGRDAAALASANACDGPYCTAV